MPDRSDSRPSTRRLIRAAAIELAAALALTVGVATQDGLRALTLACLRAAAEGAIGLLELVTVDPATLWSGLALLLKAALLAAPLVRMLATSPRQRLAWIPLLSGVLVLVLGLSVPGIVGPLMWTLFALAAVAAFWAAGRARLRPLCCLPCFVAAEPMLGHSPLADHVWAPARLAGRCADNDGEPPTGFSPELAGTRYFSVTPFSEELSLLTGERRSFWVRRKGAHLALGPELSLRGNFWPGCVREGRVLVASRGRLCEVSPPAGDTDAGSFRCAEVADPPGLGTELDFVDPLCPADREAVLVSQLLRGGLLELSSAGEVLGFQRVVPGLNLQVVPRSDTTLAAITTSRLVVFDLARGAVTEEHAAGLVALGLDVCRRDDAVAVADFAGRVRLFRPDAAGRYVFAAAVGLPAPRRLAFSPDCAHLLVTSGNDREADLLRGSDLAPLRRFALGPGLRDVAFLDDRFAVAVDACTVTLLDVAAGADGITSS